MNKIVFPLKSRMKSSKVADLQDALQHLLDNGALLANDTPGRKTLSDALKGERANQTYGASTKRLVTAFQNEKKLTPSGSVDEPTAKALNAALQQQPRLRVQPVGNPIHVPLPQIFTVTGQVKHEDDSPYPGLKVGAECTVAGRTVNLGTVTNDASGRYAIHHALAPGQSAAQLQVIAYGANNEVLCKSAVIPKPKQVEVVDLTVPGVSVKTYEVKGVIASQISVGIAGLKVEIVDKGVGGDKILAQAITDNRGAYQTAFTDSLIRQHGKAQPDIQARVFTPDGSTPLGTSDVHYNATLQETLNVLLSDKAAANLQSEHDTLTSALAGHFRGNLRDLKETDTQQDITYLANKTGWDARAVALAALADQFSAKTASRSGAPEISQAYFYALFRAGLPANESTLYHTDAKTLEGVWKQAAAQGVIPKVSDKQISNLVSRFQALSAQKLLTDPVLIGASSFKEMLTVSKLNNVQQAKFAQLYAANRADMSAFWKAVASDKDFGETPAQRTQLVNRLQVTGKLAFLTVNNAALMQKVLGVAGGRSISDLLQLAQMGYYRSEAWSPLLANDVPIPKEIPGDKPATKRANYMDYLAAQVRLSYPTASVAQMVKSKELPLKGAADGLSDKVHAFLTEQQGKFEIGVEPVERFIARNKLQVHADTVSQVKRLQRVYQITPSDQAMIGLMKHGLDAAYHVVRYDRNTFIQGFAADLGGSAPAEQTYDRSVQVHNSVLNVALGYLHARTAAPIGVHSPPSVIDPVPANPGDIIAYATLESLFGSMDFCACDHCRSILSPAAYLVDLLQFLGSDDSVWADFATTWESSHGAPYPYPDQATFTQAGSPANTAISPFEVLMSRRPDIQHVPLTCENTNTALPYIDIVNETLEYYVANQLTLLERDDPQGHKLNLGEYLGHDTDDISSEDLLANPQFVMDAAYTTLRNERFPIPLPFHQPLENLRRYFNKFEIPLPLAMERLRNSDDLERGTNSYGWRDILMEELTLSRAEYEILTDSPSAVPLWQAYGFSSGTADADVIAGLSNAKQFSQRVGITYEELIAIMRTFFVNPNGDLIPKLERLGVPFATLKALKDGTITGAAFDALLPAGLAAPDPAEYGGDIRAWVKNNDNYARIMGLITLAIPANTWAASKSYKLGDCVLPKTPPAGSTLYYQCTTAGKSAAGEPSWPAIPGKTYTDGTAVWTCRDAGSCESFGNLTFRYSDPAKRTQNIGSVEFVRLLRFVRLWKKLGWTIEQTDAAIYALYRADLAPVAATDIDTVPKLDAGFLTLLPRLGIVNRTMKALNLNVKRDLRAMLACIASIDVHDGVEWVRDNEGGLQQQIVPSFYRQLFLTPTLLAQDAAFADNGYGEFLTDATEKIADHEEALRSAFNLTSQELAQISDALKFTIVLKVPYTHTQPSLEQAVLEAAPGIAYDDLGHQLSYPETLSATARDALKAVAGVSQQFKDAVDQLFSANPTLTPLTLPNISAMFRRGWLARKLKISVREMLLLATFSGLDPFAAPDLANPSIMHFIRLVQMMRGLSFKSEAALYLIWNQDLSGKSVPDPKQVTELARTLRGDYADINDQFAAIEDPNGDVARARMTLVYGQETTDAFLALLDDTLVVDVAYTQASSTLKSAITTADPRIAYDGFRHRLSHSGLVTATIQTALKSVGGVSADFKNAVDSLHDRSEEIKGLFFTAHPELEPPYNTAVAQPPADRHSAFLAAFDPELARQRKRQQACQRLSATAGVDLVFTQAILDPAAPPYPLHAAGDQQRPALDEVLSLETPGLAAQFYFRGTATDPVDQTVAAVASLDYASGGGNPLPNAGHAISGIWHGQIEAPEAGFYNFLIEADSTATVTLTLAGQARGLTRNGNVRRNTDPIELEAGTLYEIELKAEKIKDLLNLKWETPKRPTEVIPPRYLYPPTILEPFADAYTRFLKTASLTTGLGLSANEMSFFATHDDYQVAGEGWLNALAVSGDPQPAIATALLTPFEAVLDFARIKADLSPSDESLLTILMDPATATQNPDSLLFSLTRWNSTSLNDVLGRFGGNIAGLGHFDRFRRVFDAFALIQQMGISANALIQAATNEPTADTVRNLQAALRARYDAGSWRDVVKPINDEMRGLQRDALVAYILHQMRSHPESAQIDTPDKLFEYFLMDVQMDPCMQTSRIRHALSSVQLFIERCLMNLEPRVSPVVIDTTQWEWMKRYRVWEANRKVYLFPENWLEPELRDDQSPFFKETMSELLQGDITEDRAAVALLNYLSKLEEVAKLEMCGIYHIPADPNNLDPGKRAETNHVVARTAGAHRKYYYRCLEDGSWTPWEQIKLDIEDNPVIPVVWDDRLFLVWLRILKNGPDSVQNPFNSDSDLSKLNTSNLKKGPPPVKVQGVLCWSEYYNGKWQATKTSDVNRPIDIGQFPNAGDGAFDRKKLSLQTDRGLSGELLVYISYPPGGTYTYFALYNTHSLPLRAQDLDHPYVKLPSGHMRSVSQASTLPHALRIDYWVAVDFLPTDLEMRRDVLTMPNGTPYDVVTPNQNSLSDIWDAPLFFEDSRHVFYVTTEEQPVWVAAYFGGYGISTQPAVMRSPLIPPLVMQAGPPIPSKFWGKGRSVAPASDVVDPDPMRRLVSEDAYIHQGIGTTTVVGYDGRLIEPSGSIKKAGM